MPGLLGPGLAVDLCRHGEGRPCVGPSGVEGDVGEDLRHLGPAHPVGAGELQVVPERAVGDALADQRAHRDDAAELEGECSLPAPHLAEKDIVVEADELGGEPTEPVASRRLFDCHCVLLHVLWHCEAVSGVSARTGDEAAGVVLARMRRLATAVPACLGLGSISGRRRRERSGGTGPGVPACGGRSCRRGRAPRSAPSPRPSARSRRARCSGRCARGSSIPG